MRDSFKLEDNYNKNKNKKRNNEIFLIIIFISVVALVFFACVVVVNLSGLNYVKKENKNKNYIYTIKREKNPYQEDTYDKIPKININSEKIKNINQKILLNYEQVSAKTEYNYDYKYSKSRGILSLLITYAYYLTDNDDEPTRYFETINIDLKTGNVLNDSDVLKKFNLTKNQVNDYLSVKFYNIYTDLINHKYFTKKECDYKCFLKNRQISDNYLNGVNFYVENGSLVAYKFFYTYSSYEEQDYFKADDYKFIIKK